MTTLAHYHPRGIDINLPRLSPELYNEIASLRGQIERADPPVLTCLDNGKPLYVYLHESGRYYAKHFTGDNPNNHTHVIATMSDEHRRQVEYTQRAADEHGLQSTVELSTGNGTRLDLAVYGDIDIGFEIQRSQLSRAKAKGRAVKSFTAGWATAWISDQERDPDWINDVPAARLKVRTGWQESLPPHNTAAVIISNFHRERDPSKQSGWRYVRRPSEVLLDDLAHLMPAGEIIPVVAGGVKRAVVLAPKQSREIIDSCTYPGASLWKPNTETPERKQTAQRFTRECHHPGTPVVQISARQAPLCAQCRRAPAGAGFLCEYCNFRRSPMRPIGGLDRCLLCGFHTPTQGHRSGCPEGDTAA